MSIVPQYAPAESNAMGDAVFTFPAPPQGGTWSGSLSIPTATATCAGTVQLNGAIIGAINGSGFYGPFTAEGNQTISLVVTGLTPDTQYQAVWHADTTVAVTPTPTPAVAVVGISGGGISGAASGVNTQAIALAPGESGTITGLPAAFTLWEVGWLPVSTAPGSGSVSFSIAGGTTDVLENVAYTEGGSDRLSGLSATNLGVTAENNMNEEIIAFVTYSPR